MTPGDGDKRHGTSNGYTNLDCRCELCREAWRILHREEIAKRAEVLAGEADRRTHPCAKPEPEHGRYTTYSNWGCRCRPCTDAHAAYYRELRGYSFADPYTDDERAVAVAVAAVSGATVAGRTAGVCRQTIYRWCRAAGVAPLSVRVSA